MNFYISLSIPRIIEASVFKKYQIWNCYINARFGLFYDNIGQYIVSALWIKLIL